MIESPILVDAQTRQQVVENAARFLCDYYVFPDLGQQMSDTLHAALAAQLYDDLTTPTALCERLTADLQAICHDRHVRVRYNAEARPLSVLEEISPDELAAWIAMARCTNFGFYKVERLAGNVGYLDLRTFWDPSWDGAGDTAVGAMQVLAHTNALIIDLRQNGGGAPAMVALLTSYLVSAEPVHLYSIYDRVTDKTTQSWTLPYVPGQRTPDKPVYVLTSKQTFSAAEEFTYNLQQLKRATIIGEATRGGAHPGRDISVTPHFRVFVPVGRPINPISGTNWEGTGVVPDIAVAAEEALNQAHRLALGVVLTQIGEASGEAAQTQASEARAALAELEGEAQW